jgi:hypothetical protein
MYFSVLVGFGCHFLLIFSLHCFSSFLAFLWWFFLFSSRFFICCFFFFFFFWVLSVFSSYFFFVLIFFVIFRIRSISRWIILFTWKRKLHHTQKHMILPRFSVFNHAKDTQKTLFFRVFVRFRDTRCKKNRMLPLFSAKREGREIWVSDKITWL